MAVGIRVVHFVDLAQAAPGRLVLEDLMGQLIDTGTGLARAGVAGNESATTKLIALPCQSAETCDAGFGFCDKQKP